MLAVDPEAAIDPNSESEVDETFDNSLDFESLVDPTSWKPPGEYYQTMPAAARAAVSRVVESDGQVRRELREVYFPEFARAKGNFVWEKANPQYIELLQRKRLYAGQVVAADGTLAKYETLSLVGAQIAISRVSYQETTGQFVSNIMHWGKELPRNTSAADLVAALNSRGEELKNKIPNIFLYALMTYKERQVLLNTPPGTFKLIQGTLFPHEMLSGAGRQHILLPCLNLIGALIEDGAYAAIVSHDSHRDLLALGLALDAGEYIVVRGGEEILNQYLDKAHYTDTAIPQYGGKSQKEVFSEFKERHGRKVVQGVLRAHALSPPYVFYCNRERLPEAVHMLLADAANTGPRGFPLLLDLADQYCSGTFRPGEYTSHLNAEFARASGGSGMYQTERSTRD
ncbi:MAG: hypothetical protein ACJ74J_18235 [Blastocatellia bacterium]